MKITTGQLDEIVFFYPAEGLVNLPHRAPVGCIQCVLLAELQLKILVPYFILLQALWSQPSKKLQLLSKMALHSNKHCGVQSKRRAWPGVRSFNMCLISFHFILLFEHSLYSTISFFNY